MPNPFHRPLAVFMLEVRGIDDPSLVDKSNSILSSAHSSKIVFNSKEAEIQLQDEDKVAVVSLDEPLADCTDKDIADFASWMGGSYIADTMEPLNGELTIPLGSGANVKFHMSKKADREFAVSLLSLIRNFRRAIEMHEDLSHGTQNPAELMTGCYDGIKVLQEQYGPEGIAQHGEELLLITLTKIYDTLQDAYKGRLVGIISFYRSSPPESSKMLNVKFVPRVVPRPSARWLEETKPSYDSLPEVVLVRRTLAWITGIILVIATLLGVYYLVSMPLTRDTLLYSNVKLD
jgi:renin receptor